MSKKSRKNKQFELDINICATESDQPQQKKKFHHKDLIQYQPITPTQKRLFDTFRNDKDKNLILIGSAGTGKSFCSLFLALDEFLLNDQYSNIIIIRSCVSSRDIGHLPGDIKEKSEIYELPYQNICDELFKFSNSYKSLKKLNIVEFNISSFVRGTTFNDSIVIIDEIQNMNWNELYSVVTRIGNNSRLIMCGDIRQNDLNKSKTDITGFDKFLNVVKKIPEHFEILEFNHNDIVRSELVKSFIIGCEII